MTCLQSLRQRNPVRGEGEGSAHVEIIKKTILFTQDNFVILLCMFVWKCFSGFPEEIQIKMWSIINPQLSVSIRVSDQA